MKNKVANKISNWAYPLLKSQERLLVWEKAIGMWKNRKPDPIKELNKIRKEWQRKLPPLHSKLRVFL